MAQSHRGETRLYFWYSLCAEILCRFWDKGSKLQKLSKKFKLQNCTSNALIHPVDSWGKIRQYKWHSCTGEIPTFIFGSPYVPIFFVVSEIQGSKQATRSLAVAERPHVPRYKSLKVIENGTIHRSHTSYYSSSIVNYSHISIVTLDTITHARTLHYMYAGIAELIARMFFEMKRNIGRNTTIFNTLLPLNLNVDI